MSFLTRLWNVIRNPIRYAGRDLEGNRFYERSSPNDVTRTTRSVQYLDPEDMWKYTGGGKRLPIQWSAWLTHTRFYPPTVEELQADVRRQQRVLANVALIEAKNRAEDHERLRIRQEDTQRALQRALFDVSSSDKYLRREEGSGMQNSNTASRIRGKQEPDASKELNTGILALANGLKIRPPTLLTPPKLPKPQPTMPMSSSAPSDVSRNMSRLTQSSFRREHQCKTETGPSDTAQSASSDSAAVQTQKSTDVANPLPVMPSRVTETESWAPKARPKDDEIRITSSS